jgi:hypothetical protein
MHETEDKHGGYAGKEQADCQRIPEREFARPQQEASSHKTDGDAENVRGGEAMHKMRDDVDEKDSGKVAGEVVVPLHQMLRDRSDVFRAQAFRGATG